MNSHFQFKLDSRHLLACFVLICFCQVLVAAGGKQKQKHVRGPVNLRNIQNATERQGVSSDGDDSVIFSALRKILPDPEEIRFRPPPNYLQIILNASGVLGLGFLWIKEISAALGTPILAPILIPPLVLLAAALLLIPDLSRVGELLDNAVMAG